MGLLDNLRKSDGTIEPSSIPVSDLGLSIRATKSLEGAGIRSVRDLLAMKTADELLEIRNFGQTSFKEVRDKLAELGLQFPKTDDDYSEGGWPEDTNKWLMEMESKLKEGYCPVKDSHWVLKKQLGKGGFGEVWLALHEELDGQKAAFKFCKDKRRIQSLKNELEKVQKLDHAGIVRLENVYLNAEISCLQYEFIDGPTLGEFLDERSEKDKGGPFDPVAAAEIILKITDIVRYAHDQDPKPLVHRDLKPSNILVANYKDLETFRCVGAVPDLRCAKFKITDFGISSYGRHADDSSTAGQSLGRKFDSTSSFPYHSPEQLEAFVRNDGSYTPHPADDVYALGMLWNDLLVDSRFEQRQPTSKWRDELKQVGMTDKQIDVLESCLEIRRHRIPNAIELAKRIRIVFFANGDQTPSLSDALGQAATTYTENRVVCRRVPVSVEAAQGLSYFSGSRIQFGAPSLDRYIGPPDWLTHDIARTLAGCQSNRLDLAIGSLSKKAAGFLSGYKGDELYIRRLSSISPEAAEALRKYQGTLILSDLKSLPVETAQALAAGSFRELKLNGLTTLEEDVAAALAGFLGETLALNGLEALEIGAARKLSGYGNAWLRSSGGEILSRCPDGHPHEHSDDPCFSFCPAEFDTAAGQLELKGLKEFPDEDDDGQPVGELVTEALRDSECGKLDLSGLTSIKETEFDILMGSGLDKEEENNCCRWICLDGLKSLPHIGIGLGMQVGHLWQEITMWSADRSSRSSDVLGLGPKGNWLSFLSLTGLEELDPTLGWFPNTLRLPAGLTGQGGRTILHYMVERANIRGVRGLVDGFGEDEFKDLVNTATDEGYTPLMLAVSQFEISFVHAGNKLGSIGDSLEYEMRHALACLLLDHGADLNVCGEDGVTVLHQAAMWEIFRKNTERINDCLVERLLRAGANPVATDASGDTPLMSVIGDWAIEDGLERVVSALLVSPATEHDETWGGQNRVEVQVHEGVNYTRTKDGATPLHLAAAAGALSTVKLLLEHGAHFTVKNAVGRTPLDEALEHRRIDGSEPGIDEVIAVLEEKEQSTERIAEMDARDGGIRKTLLLGIVDEMISVLEDYKRHFGENAPKDDSYLSSRNRKRREIIRRIKKKEFHRTQDGREYGDEEIEQFLDDIRPYVEDLGPNQDCPETPS